MVLRRISPLLILLACQFGVLNAVLAQPSSTGAADRVAIVVNGQPIVASELAKREKFLRIQLAATKQPIPPDAELRETIKQRTVSETIILGLAKKQGTYPSEDDVTDYLETNASQAGVSLADYLARFRLQGVSESEHRTDVAELIAMNRTRDRYLSSRVKVTDAEVATFLRDPASGIRQEYEVYVLAMNKNDSTGDTSRLGAAQALRERAVSATGDAFKALQASVTDTPRGHAVASGFKTLEQMPSRFAEVAASMTVGQTSALVETSGGYFILRLNNAKTIYPTSIQTGVSHILLAATDGVSMDQAQKEAERLHNMLVLNPKRFEALAKEFSADGSAANGGDLGIILPGDTVPEFERMMDLMAPGEISRPTRSQFGWHIIRTNSRETLEIPRARLLAQAKQMISQRKADTELRNWVEQLNKDAFVEYR